MTDIVLIPEPHLILCHGDGCRFALDRASPGSLFDGPVLSEESGSESGSGSSAMRTATSRNLCLSNHPAHSITPLHMQY